MSSNQAYELLQDLQAVIFVGLGLIAFLQWRRRGGPAAAWLAATFGSLAAVVIAGEILPEDGVESALSTWVEKATIVLIVLFPWFLYRFAISFFDPTPWFLWIANALTLAAVAGGLLLDFPEEGEPGSPLFRAYVYLVLVQWVLLIGRVGMRLWSAGRGQPTVSRRRMRTLSIGSLGLAAALVVAVLAGPTERPHAAQFFTQFLALLSGPFLLLGFAPPKIVRSSWRFREQAELREAEISLLSADDPAQIAEILLPHVTQLVGGQGSVLVDNDGAVVGTHGFDDDAARALVAEQPAQTGGQTLRPVSVPLQAGRLLVRPSAFTPFFGSEDIDILRGLAAVADLALARADLLRQERRISQELRAANEAMRDFVAIASHDLRTPITVIRGFCLALEQQWGKVSDAEKREFLSMMGRQAEHLSRLVDDLLTVSRIDADVVEAQKEAVEIVDAIDQALEGLDADIAVDASPGLAALADPHHVHRMLRNYLENALSYGRPPVMVEAKTKDGWIEVMVRDHGKGVDIQFKERLFDKFTRAETSHSEGKQGTGLGLSIVKGLAMANGGEAWYEPNVPEGSCFGIRLPSAQS